MDSPAHGDFGNFALGALKVGLCQMTCVSELLYRNIVSQPGTLLVKKPCKPLKIKRLFLFSLSPKNACNWKLRTWAKRHMGDVT
jgi:hypothetical protein